REDSWDNWHLSTGPVVQQPGFDPVMFYNGATIDARWRIGWISFDADYTRVTGRCVEPMLVPPPAAERSAADMAFAASTVIEGDMIALYFSLEDSTLRRAMVRAYH
ncbi:MAG: glycosidase, partial [Croceibacterium sp.]